MKKLGTEVLVPTTAAAALYIGLNLWAKTGYAVEMFGLPRRRARQRAKED